MARNIATYIANLSKSVTYSAVDRVKDIAPSVGAFTETNTELFKDIYTNIRQYKVTYKKGMNTFKKSKIYEAGDALHRSIIEDIKTGNFYNKNREDSTASDIMDSQLSDMSMDDFDIGGFNEDQSPTDTSNIKLARAINSSARENTDAVSMAMARTGEYIVENQKISNNIMFSQNLKAYNLINKNLNAVNDNVSNILGFSREVLQKNAENAKKYYETTTKLMENQVKLLQNISETLVPKNDKKENKKKTQYSDLLGSEDMLNIKDYFGNIKHNLKNSSGPLSMLQGLGGEDSNPLLALVSSPLKFIPDMIAKKIIPNTIENSMKEFDKSFSNFFGSLIMKFNTMASDDSMLKSTLGGILGVKNQARKEIDSSKYNKAKVDWDGKSKKALEEVIPAHLSRIESLLSGATERVFDYDKGSFIDSDKLKENYDNELNRFKKNATSDMKDEFDKYMKLITFSSLEEKKKLTEDIDKIFTQMYNTGKMFEINSKTIDEDYMKYGVDQKNFKIFRKFFSNAPRHMQHQINQSILTNRDAQTNFINRLEDEGSIYSNLFNGSKANAFLKKNKKTNKLESTSLSVKNNIKNVLDNKGHNLFYYLQNMYKELQILRVSNGGGNSLRNIQITRGDETYSSSPMTINDIEIPNASNITDSRRTYERDRRNNEQYLRNEDKRKQKNSNIVNVSEFEDDKKLEARLQSMIDVNNIHQNLEERRNRGPSFIDRLLQAESISGKSRVVIELLNDISKKPLKFFTDVLDKVDKRMYHVIYGSENGDDRGFMTVMVDKVKDTFNRLNSWIDDKILEPIRKKLQVENIRDVGKKFLGMFGIDADELKQKMKDFFVGEDGILTSTKEAIKNTFTNAFSTIKDSMSSVYSPLIDKFKNRRQNRHQVTEEDFETLDEDETSEERESRRGFNSRRRKKRNRRTNQPGSFADETEGLSPSEKLDYIRYRMRNYEKYNNYNITNAQTNINDMDQEHNNLLNNSNSINRYYGNMMSPDLYNQLRQERRQSEHKLKSAKQNYNDYYEMTNSYLTQMLSDKLGLDDLEQDKISSALGMSINRIKHDNSNSTKTSETIDISNLLYSLSLMRGETAKSLHSKISGLGDKYGNSSIQAILENAVEPENDRASIEDLADRYQGLINGNISEPMAEIDETLSNIYDLLNNKFNNSNQPQSNNFGPRLIEHRNPNLNTEEGQAVQNFSDSIANWMYNNMNHYDEGGLINTPQVATVGEGEAVLSRENVNKLTEVLAGLVESIKGKDLKNSEIAKNTFNSLGDIVNNKNFKESLYLAQNDDSVLDKTYDLNEQDTASYNRILYAIYNKSKSIQENASSTIENNISPVIKEVSNELKSGATNAIDALFGRDPDDDENKFKNAINDVTGHVSKYAPEAIGSGLLGAGVSVLTGAIGGPLLGASVGAGISLVRNSEAAQKWLFGESIDGEYQGGAVSKNTLKAFKKYFPDLKKYGIAGGVTGLMPFLPFGPVGGLLLGSTFAMAKNNDDVQKALFGETGFISDKSKDTIKKMLPKAAAGALVGATIGPFGLLGNVALGSMGGLATTSEKFRTMLLGTYNPHTKQYENGILPQFREHLIDPLKEGMKSFKDQIGDFLKNDIFSPLKKFTDPLKQQAKVMAKSAKKSVGKFFDFMFESAFGVPFHKFVQDRFVKPISKLIVTPLKWAGKAAKNIIKSPFTLAGKAGEKLRSHQIKKGTAYDMTAEERLDYRKKHKIGKNDKMRSTDVLLKNLSKQGLEDLHNQVGYLQDNGKELKTRRQEIASQMGENLSMHFGYGDSKNIMTSIRDGNFGAAKEYMGINIDPNSINNDVVSDILKNKDKFSNMENIEYDALKNVRNTLSDKFKDDEDTKIKLIQLINQNDKSSIQSLLSDKLSENDSSDLMKSLNDNYFNIKDKHNSEKNEFHSDIENRLGEYVGKDAKNKIMKRLRSGDIDLASQMLSLQIQGKESNKSVSDASDLYNEYQEHNKSQEKVLSKFNSKLDQTFDFDDKNKVTKLLKQGKINEIEDYLSSLPGGRGYVLLDQIKPHMDDYMELENNKNNVFSNFQNHINENNEDLTTLSKHKIFKNFKKGNYNDMINTISDDLSTDQKMELLEFMSDGNDKLSKLKMTTDDKNQIKSSLYEQLETQTGIKFNEDNIDNFISMLNTEIKNKDDRNLLSNDESNEENTNRSELKVMEDQMDMNKTYHHDVLSLFEQAINLLQQVADPTKENRTMRDLNESNDPVESQINSNHDTTGNEEERQATQEVANEVADTIYNNSNHYAKGGFINKAQLATLSSGEAVMDKDNVSKFLDTLKEFAKLKNNENNDTKIVTDTKGNVVEYKRDNRGELVPDLSDSSTKKALENAKHEDEQNSSLLSKFSKFFKRDKEEDDPKNKKDKKKKGILGKLLGMLGLGGGLLGKLGGKLGGLFSGGGLLRLLTGRGLLGKGLGIAGGLMILPDLIKFGKEYAVPWLKESGIPMLHQGLSTLFHELPGMLADAFKYTFTELIPNLASAIGGALGMSGEHGEESVGQRAGKTVARHVLTGGRTSAAVVENIGKKNAEKFAEKGILGKAGHVILHPISSATTGIKRATVGGVGKAAEIVNKGYSKIDEKFKIPEKMSKISNIAKEKAGSILNTAKEKSGGILSNAKDSISKFFNNNKGSAVVKAADGAKTLVEGFVRNIKEFLHKLLTHETVQKLAGAEVTQKIVKTAIPKIMETVGERALKASAIITGKITAAASSAGLLNLAWAVADFISGFRHAEDILSITQDATLGMKFVAGLIKALNGLFIVTSFIPEKVWVDLIMDIILPLFGKEDGDFAKMRKDAEKEVAEYNKKNNTNYNVEQYNHEVVEPSKPTLWNKIKNSSWVGSIKNMGLTLGQKVKDFWGSTKETASNMWEKTKNVGSSVLDKMKNAGSSLYNWAFGNGEGELRGGFGNKPDGQFPISDKPLTDKNYGTPPSQQGGFGSGDVVKNGMVYYSQGDPQWKGTQYGTGTIGATGCGPTSAAMVISSLSGKHVTPVETAAYSVQHGFRVPNVGTNWGFFENIGNAYGVPMHQTNDKGAILQALSNKQPVILSGRGAPPFTKGGHFIVATGMEGDNIKINDPVNQQRSKAYSKDQILNQMRAGFISSKALDGKLVDNAASASSGGTAESSTQQPQEEKPSIMSLFSDFGKTFSNGINRFFGFENQDSVSGSSGSTGSPTVDGGASGSIAEYIKSKEGFFSNLYRDSGGTPTIGYGSTHGWIMNKSSVTKEEASKALNEELQQVAQTIKADLDKKGVKLKQNEFDALCSFGYNLGTGALFKSSLYKQVCAGTRGQAITDEFNKFVHCGSKVLPGLVKRRKEEAAIFAGSTVPSYSNGGGGFGIASEKLGIGGPTEITSDTLKKFFPAGKLRDNADYIIQSANKHGVDPALAAAIMMEETGGNSKALNQKNNPAGVYNPKGGNAGFETIQEGIDFSIRNLRKGYIDQGLTTIEKIGAKYCPPGAANDLNGTNSGWVPAVKSLYKRLTGKDNLDGTVVASSSQPSQPEEEKPSIMSLFSDFSKTFSSGINKFFGFDSESSSSNDPNNMSTSTGTVKTADNWFAKSMSATVSSKMDPNRTINGKASPHFGIDYAAKEGSTIKSPISGTVYKNEASKDGYGNHVIIKDEQGYYHYFGHMKNQSSLNVGSKVSSGQSLGLVGSTGNSTGPHLHYEVRTPDGKKIDPNEYLSKSNNQPTGGEEFDVKKSNNNVIAVSKSQSDDNTNKLLTAMITILTKICDNTNTLSDILNVLTSKFTEKGDTQTVKQLEKIKTSKNNSAEQLANILKKGIDSGKTDNDFILDTLTQLALQ